MFCSFLQMRQGCCSGENARMQVGNAVGSQTPVNKHQSTTVNQPSHSSHLFPASQHEFRTNEIPTKVITDIVPVKNAYPRKDCGDRKLKTVWKYNQRPRVFAIRTVQNLGNLRECVALTYKVSSDVRPCRESLVKRSISFLFRYLYDPQTAKEGQF